MMERDYNENEIKAVREAYETLQQFLAKYATVGEALDACPAEWLVAEADDQSSFTAEVGGVEFNVADCNGSPEIDDEITLQDYDERRPETESLAWLLEQ